MLKILLVIDRYCNFHKSEKLKKQLREIMNFNNNEVRKIINHVSARWLRIEKCLNRTLMQCDSVELYFLSNFDLYDDPIEIDLGEKYSRKKRLVNAFKQPISKLCAMFFHSVIPIFGSLNTFLQEEEPLIHKLYLSALRLYRSLLAIFILLELISESDDVLSIDLEDPNVLKDFNSIFIGTMIKGVCKGQ